MQNLKGLTRLCEGSEQLEEFFFSVCRLLTEHRGEDVETPGLIGSRKAKVVCFGVCVCVEEDPPLSCPPPPRPPVKHLVRIRFLLNTFKMTFFIFWEKPCSGRLSRCFRVQLCRPVLYCLRQACSVHKREAVRGF